MIKTKNREARQKAKVLAAAADPEDGHVTHADRVGS